MFAARPCFFFQVGDVTVLVNNAAVVHGKSLMDSDDDALLKSQHINTLGQFWVRPAGVPAAGSLPGISPELSFLSILTFGSSLAVFVEGNPKPVNHDSYYGVITWHF